MTVPCRLCGGSTESLFRAEQWAPSALLLAEAGDRCPRFTLELGCCKCCGLVQLVDPPIAPIAPLTPGVEPREPEAHLDELADRLLQQRCRARVAWYSGKDGSLVERLRRRGWQAMDGADPSDRADVVLMRHRLEHELDPCASLRRLSEQLAPDGLVVVEVPACESEMASGDIARIWDEHLQYFTAASLEQCLLRAGLSLVWSWRTAAEGEELLIVAARPGSAVVAQVPGTGCTAAAAFLGGIGSARLQAAQRLDGRTVSLFGTGHHGLSWIRLLGLGRRLSQVLDDHPCKQGRFIPDVVPAIEPTNRLGRLGPGVCLLAVRPEAEERIIARHAAWLGEGGSFASISPASPHYLFTNA